MRVNIVLNYEYGYDEDFEDINGEGLSEVIGQSSANEIIGSLEKDAILQLVDDNGNIIKTRNIKLNF